MNSSNRFSGVTRLYGVDGHRALTHSHVVIIGIGGVGSWAAEALARTDVGHLTLIDLDDVSETNINRQLHAMSSTIDQSKTELMKQRILDINPACCVTDIGDFVTPNNVGDLIPNTADVIIDAIDAVKAKAAIIAFAKRAKIKIITTGGAGGKIDPLQITKGDLAKTIQDPLSAKVRSELRRNYGFSNNPKRRFGVECIYSTEQLRYPTKDGGVSREKQQQQGSGKMDCNTGFGSFVAVTSNVGMMAAARAIDYITRQSS